ncbi:ISAzo13-like element transposase-related protein [Nostoc sp.]
MKNTRDAGNSVTFSAEREAARAQSSPQGVSPWQTLRLQSPWHKVQWVPSRFKVDNGPESSGVRTQFLNRMVEFVDQIQRPIQLLYYPPYHSKYNPIERCWGILEQHWNGGKLVDVEAMLSWASSMTWKGLPPILTLSKTIYQK